MRSKFLRLRFFFLYSIHPTNMRVQNPEMKNSVKRLKYREHFLLSSLLLKPTTRMQKKCTNKYKKCGSRTVVELIQKSRKNVNQVHFFEVEVVIFFFIYIPLNNNSSRRSENEVTCLRWQYILHFKMGVYEEHN